MERIAVVCHASGGSELISNWIKNKKSKFIFVLEGTAKHIFQRNLGNINTVNLDKALDSSDWVLCGSSWNSDLEKIAITKAKNMNKKVVVYLDHWVCYKERLSYKGKDLYPDEIWVGDNYAHKMASEMFKNIPIIYQENMYLENLRNEYKQKFTNQKASKNKEGIDILYVAENINEHAVCYHGDPTYWGYTEEEAILFFLENIYNYKQKIKSIRIRPHPTEKSDKYKWVKDISPLVKSIGSSRTLIEEIGNSDLVVGCETMAMVVALSINKKVMSSIPPKGRHCVLPQKEIIHLKNIINKSRSKS